MKRKYYLIDTENVGDRWMNLPDKIDKKDRLIVFYTDHHSKTLEKCLMKQLHNPHIIWLECMAGNNALDYQLIGVLSYLITKHSNASFYVYSNDKDYCETVEYWKSRGIRIVQELYEVIEKKKGKKKKKKKKKSADTAALESAAATYTGNFAGLEDQKQLLIEIARVVPVRRMNRWYTALTAFLGQENGRAQYRQFKDKEQLRTALSEYLEGDGRQQQIGLLRLALKYGNLDPDQAENIYQIIMLHGCKNLSAIKCALDEKFGMQPPQRYYAVVRPFIKEL